MDSTALAWWLRPEVAYTVDYGQASAAGEIRAASAIAAAVGAHHTLIRVDCSSLGSGDLAGSAPLRLAPVPEWWPFRNQLLITLAGMQAVSDGVGSLLIASVRTDCQHIDGTAEFFTAADSIMSLQEGAIRVSAPALTLTTEELVRRSQIPADVLAWAHSCHTGPYACGSCRGCNKHYSVTQNLWGEGY
jgi:7-cyano-7-deazaguanine synthase